MPFQTTKFPDKKMVIITCMDTRLIELLPKALNIRNGDVKMIKTAGALISHPFGAVMRSVLVAVYELQAEEVLVIGHHECGMSACNPVELKEKFIERGISKETIDILENSGINLTKWLQGFGDVSESVKHSVNAIRNHPLFPKDTAVHGLVISPSTGKVEIVDDGRK